MFLWSFLSVLLPYRFTLFSNYSDTLAIPTQVLLPYRFTLFSNPLCVKLRRIMFYYLIDLHYSQTHRFRCTQFVLFYYLIDLHYSQTTICHLFLRFYVLLPYRFTLFSNYTSTPLSLNAVLLPYRFTLFSNGLEVEAERKAVLLPYRFTLFSNGNISKDMETVVLLPYRFTLFSNLK